VQMSIGRTWDKLRELPGVICDKKFPKKVKALTRNTVIQPMLLNGAQTGPLTNYLAERFSVHENQS